jgi:inorganic triphosphatase YgiF
MSAEERELKLMPLDAGLLERLAGVEHLGQFTVVGRRLERQRNSFFDTRDGALRAARVGFRRREVEGNLLATWSLKGQGSQRRGVATRTEIEVQLAADTAPALAIGTLREAARQRGALALAEQVRDALVTGVPVGEPVLVTQTERQIRDLEAAGSGWRVEMTLDRVRLVGHAYAETEIEVELKEGDEAALDAARAAIELLGGVRESPGSKLSRAMAHLEACACGERGCEP